MQTSNKNLNLKQENLKFRTQRCFKWAPSLFFDLKIETLNILGFTEICVIHVIFLCFDKLRFYIIVGKSVNL